MKTKRVMTLSQALDEIGSVSQEIRSRGAAVVDGRPFALHEPVTLEIESEAGKKEAELEFEIKFQPTAPEAGGNGRRRRGRSPLLIGVASAAALGAAVFAWRRSHRGENEDDETGC